MMDQIAQLALVEFRKRQANARKAIAAGAMTTAQAEAALRPWAAIALWCGADFAEAEATIDNIVVIRGPAIERQERRCIVARGLCDWPRAVAALAAARDKALARGDTAAAEPLARIGEVVGPLPAYQLERKAA